MVALLAAFLVLYSLEVFVETQRHQKSAEQQAVLKGYCSRECPQQYNAAACIDSRPTSTTVLCSFATTHNLVLYGSSRWPQLYSNIFSYIAIYSVDKGWTKPHHSKCFLNDSDGCSCLRTCDIAGTCNQQSTKRLVNIRKPREPGGMGSCWLHIEAPWGHAACSMTLHSLWGTVALPHI